MSSLFRLHWLLRIGCLLAHGIVKIPLTEFQNLQEHINLTGDFHWNVKQVPPNGQLRPLRTKQP